MISRLAVALIVVVSFYLASAVDAFGQATIQNGLVFNSPLFPPTSRALPDASARLIRNDKGFSFHIGTTHLTPGDAHSVWLFLLDGDGDFFVLNAGGGIAGGKGKASFAGHVSAGEIPGQGNFDDPQNSNAIFIIRTHGPAIPGLIHEQFTTLNGGCNPGEPNFGLCEDRQLVLFP